jgi:hypothetical protein
MGTLHDVLEYLNGERNIPAHRGWAAEADADGLDLADVLGHRWAKRALEIAAAGGHNLLMLARRGRARPAAPGQSFHPCSRGGHRDHRVVERGRPAVGRSRAHARAALPCAAPHLVGSGIDRRWHRADPCRRGCVSLEACVCTAGEKRQCLSKLLVPRPLIFSDSECD